MRGPSVESKDVLVSRVGDWHALLFKILLE